MNMKSVIYSLLTITIFFSSGYSQQTPAEQQSEPISVVGATAHIGNGDVIQDALVIFENGKIKFVGKQNGSQNPEGKIINADGKHIYPGFIAPNSTLGLVEIDAVKASDDEDEIGNYLPHIRSLIAYNAESKVVESMRPNGVLMGQITPRGGRISGTSSIVQFDAWNWEDASVKTDDAIHINWPGNFSYSWRERNYNPNKNYQKQLDELMAFFEKSRAYSKSNSTEVNTVLEAMVPVFEGQKKVFIHVNSEKGIIDALAFKRKFEINHMVIVGGEEAHKVSAEIKSENVPVIVQRVHSVPQFEGDDYDLPYKLPKLLHEAGILVALDTSGQMERMNTRNLPFYAGTAVAYGLDKDEALKMITLNAAKILGIDDFAGSLEVGKDATLFISEGDALDMMGNQLTHAFIQGREISLETHQTKLYKRYSNKYEHNTND
jgi:imidazolonepropionase-like amidohydrolase